MTTETEGRTASVIPHPDAEITMEPLPSGRHLLRVRMHDPGAHIWKTEHETSLTPELVAAYVEAHGPAGVCYALNRLEDPSQLRLTLKFSLFPFVAEEEFAGKRILDFGCGSGTSTFVLADLLPDATIVGVDLLDEFLVAARLLAEHRGTRNVSFVNAVGEDTLPDKLGSFDFVTLNAVVEHLLPQERRKLLPALWVLLKPGGVMFVNQTPHRWYPLEYHTTGLPLMNYLPKRLARRAAVTLRGEIGQRSLQRDVAWEQLLRWGFRGSTQGEIICYGRDEPIVLTPRLWGYGDAVDLWYARSVARRPHPLKEIMRAAFKAVSRLTGRPFVPEIVIALQRRSS